MVSRMPSAKSIRNRSWFTNAISRLTDPKDLKSGFAFAGLLLVFESLLTLGIIYNVPYTEIDWIAYMQEVEGYEQGERDYLKIEGDTGPLVYPAGFVHLFSWLKGVTGGEIFHAQIIYSVLYIAHQAVVMLIYISTRSITPLSLCLLCISRRIHSIFMLRLFNDCWAMTLAYLGILCLQMRKVSVAILIFSIAVSIKMNVLLFAPGVLAVAVKISNLQETLLGVLAGVLFQIFVALPFLVSHPWSYLSQAFEFSRVFKYIWTVNWKFLPENWFLSKQFALVLIAMHLRVLWSFVHYRWFHEEGGPKKAVQDYFSRNSIDSVREKQDKVRNDTITSILFVSNFIGILCARSLHYQFYSWYFHSIPFLLLRTKLPGYTKAFIFIAIEVVWNVFPANSFTSSTLLFSHLLMLWGTWALPAPFPLKIKALEKRKNF